MIVGRHAVRRESLELIAAALQTLNLSTLPLPPFPGLKVETVWRIGFHPPVVAAQIEALPASCTRLLLSALLSVCLWSH